jgi:hypothetical protein
LKVKETLEDFPLHAYFNGTLPHPIEGMPRKRRKTFEQEDQFILIKSEASYPRRWQGIRSNKSYDAQVKGTMFEPKPEDTQMDLFVLSEPQRGSSSS